LDSLIQRIFALENEKHRFKNESQRKILLRIYEAKILLLRFF